MSLRARQAAAALLLDALLGEPPASLHPVVWMGRAISSVERKALAWTSPRARLLSGAALALSLPALAYVVVGAMLQMTPKPLRWSLEAVLLSVALSMRDLARAAVAVERELKRGDLEAARARVGEFVGRDTGSLSEAEVARAAVESVAENTSDGVIAPMLYGFLFGAPGAFAYKATNTLDSMVGHREAPYTEFGWASARLDDLANLLAARLTAVLAAAVSGHPAATLSSARRYGPLTSSPNAGWTEAAFAGALGVRLGGTNSYGGVIRKGPTLGDGRPPVPRDIRRAVTLMRRLCALFTGSCFYPRYFAVVEGWAEHAGGRHHGAHGALASHVLPLSSEILDFSQNVNPLGPPAGALDAARRAVTEESGTYPALHYPDLREALALYLDVPATMILPTNGGAEALFLAARAAAENPGRKAIVLEPTFSEYAAAARMACLEPVHRISHRPEHGFAFDAAALEDLEDVAAVFLCNPNNPTGDVLSRDEVLEVAAKVREAGATLIVDEAFADFVPHASVASEADERLYVARSLTKFFAIPGLRLGCLISADPERAQSFQPSWSVNAPAAAAGAVAARDRNFAERSISAMELLREALHDSLNALPGIEAFPGAANFLLCRGPAELAGRLARRGVLVRGCEPFVGLGPEYFRVAIRGEEQNGRLISALREEL